MKIELKQTVCYKNFTFLIKKQYEWKDAHFYLLFSIFLTNLLLSNGKKNIEFGLENYEFIFTVNKI